MFIALLAAPQWARATASEEEELPAYVLDEILVSGTRERVVSTVATKLPMALHLTPASVSSVAGPTMEAQGNRVLGDALRNVSGVHAQTGFGVFDFFTIRGFDSLTSGLVLNDGVPEPEVTFYDLYNVERVEVLKGPAAFLYGGNPLSGAVNLQRKQPLSQPFVRASAGAGRFQALRGGLDAGGPIGPEGGDFSYRLNAQWRDGDNYRDDKESQSLSVNPVARWKMAEDHQLTASVETITSEYKSDAGLPVLAGELARVPRTRSYQSPFDVSDQEILRFRLDYGRRLDDDTLLRNKLYFTRLDWKSKGTLLTGPAFNQLGETVPGHLGRTLTLLDDVQKLLGNQLELELEGRTGRAHHRFLIGLEVARMRDDYGLDIALLPSIDLQTPQETAAQPLFIIPSQSGSGRTTTRALYLVDAISLSQGLKLFAAGRLDAVGYKDEKNGIDQDFTEFSPMLGAVHVPHPDLSVYASAGRGFAPPSSLGRGDRRLERSEQLEVGAKARWRESAVATVAVYHISKDVRSDDGVTARRGRQKARGIEVEVGWTASRWSGTGGYAFSAAELDDFAEEVVLPTGDGGFFQQRFDRSANDPAFAPRHLANLWVHHLLPWATGASAAAGLRFVGSQFSAEDNAYEIDGVLLADAALSYRISGATLRLQLSNLTDRKYETRGFGSSSVIPADPLSVRGSVDWTW